jgi:hypothetical protein
MLQWVLDGLAQAYAGLAAEKYGLPTYPVLINVLPPSSTTTIRDRYEASFMGLQVRQDYRVINLWEVDLATGSPGGSPA